MTIEERRDQYAKVKGQMGISFENVAFHIGEKGIDAVREKEVCGMISLTDEEAKKLRNWLLVLYPIREGKIK